MPVIFLKLSGELPSLAEMKSFLNDSYVPKDEDMEPWNKTQPDLNIQFGSDYIDLDQRRDNNSIFRLRSNSKKLVYQLGYFLAVIASGKISFTKDGEFIDIKNLEPLLEEFFSIKHCFDRVEKMSFLLPDFFNEHFRFMQHRVTKKLYRFNYRDGRRRVQGACSNMNMPLTDWVGKGDQSILNFKSNNLIKIDFFAFVLVSYSTQEWFFVMWQVNGRRFWFGERNLGVYHNVDFVNTKSKLEELIQQWDLKGKSIFHLDGRTLETEDKLSYFETLLKIFI